jgi:hypothetical protein
MKQALLCVDFVHLRAVTQPFVIQKTLQDVVHHDILGVKKG